MFDDIDDPSMDCNSDYSYTYDDDDDDDDDDYEYDYEYDYDDDAGHIHYTNKQYTIRNSPNWNSFALSQYYNKEEKRSTFGDITVKVQTQVYRLDKMILALKSPYFETLFTGDFEERKYDEIEIHTIDEDTFSSIVDYIYGANLRTEVLNGRNFASLFIAMDYLQMEIDLKIFESFLSKKDQVDDRAVFQLHDFVSLLPELESLTTAIRLYFSKNLKKIGNSLELLSLAPATLTEVLSAHSYKYADTLSETRCIRDICAEWICHDFQKRLPHIIDLVNAVKRRFGISFTIGDANYRAFEEPDEKKRKERVKEYFNRLLNHSAEIRPEFPITDIRKKSKPNTFRTIQVRRQKHTLVHKIDYAAKWKMNIEQKNFCDVSIRAGDEIFQLHRIQLSLEVPYFHDLFSQSPNQEEYALEATIDGATFRKIVDYIYYEEIDLTKETQIVRILRSCLVLQMEHLKNKIDQYVRNNLNLMKGIAFEFLFFINENEEFLEHREALESFIGVEWEEICKEPGFHETPIDILEYVVNLPILQLTNEHGLLNICSEWIHYDAKNRYQFIPKLALAINRRPEVTFNFEKYNSAQREDFNYSKEQIEHQLKNILSSTQLVSIPTSLVQAHDLADELIPYFIIFKDEEISVVNADFDEITSIALFSPIRRYSQIDLSAVKMNDNLFILLADEYKFSFHVYNLHSNKFKSLTCNFEMQSSSPDFCLINGDNELYFWSDYEDYIWKYSTLLNRWIRIFENEAKYSKFMTSNGKILYAISPNDPDRRSGVLRLYDFEKQSWMTIENPPIKRGPGHKYMLEHITIEDISIIDGNLAVLFDNKYTAIYRQEIQNWKVIANCDKNMLTFKQYKDSIVYIRDSSENYSKNSVELYSFSTVDEQWQLKKKLQMKYQKIVSVQSV